MERGFCRVNNVLILCEESLYCAMEHTCSQLGSGMISNGRMTAEDAKTSEDWKILEAAARQRYELATSLKPDLIRRCRITERFCRMKVYILRRATSAVTQSV